ncbi:MAG: helix-turn-helix domain-containing protein [Bacteroidales bacterium]|jgi:AraC-like DNA-binding protein|nr:helix-turn-helix domain-containing protein [Bacteroidales bacterium]
MEYNYAIWPLTTLEYLFYITLWSYSFVAIYYVIRYKKQINQSYSFDSHKINLSWLLIVIIGYFITYNLLMLIIKTYFEKLDYEELLVFINGAQLIFIYLLSYFGFLQQQLISDKKSVVLSKFVIKEADSNTYQKSGLKEITKVEENLKKLINCMNTFEPWKDNELSVTKLSELTGIPKHYITQILNDNLQKNFYTFINEYRTEYVKKLIISPKYSHWSIVSIAYESGFNSKAAFNNFFKKYTGMTPSQYKELNSNKP